MRNTIERVALLLLLGSGLPAAGQTRPVSPDEKQLDRRHAEYLQLDRQIFARHDDAEALKGLIIEPSRVDEIESRAGKVVRDAILSSLSSANPTADGVKKAIDAVQGELSFRGWWGEGTNTPFTELSDLKGRQILTAAYVVMAGAEGIPNTHAHMGFYVKGVGGWEPSNVVEAMTGPDESADFRASRLFVARIKSGLAGENWYLVWGNRLGDSGVRLNVRIYGFDGSKVRTVWKREDLVGGEIEVLGDTVTLEYSKDRHSPARTRETLYITPNGLE